MNITATGGAVTEAPDSDSQGHAQGPLYKLAIGVIGIVFGDIGTSRGWRPHVTIQNKVPPKAARALIAALSQGFVPCPLAVSGLGLHCYLGGPWETIAVYPFRG